MVFWWINIVDIVILELKWLVYIIFKNYNVKLYKLFLI